MRYLLLFFLSFPAYATVWQFQNVLFNDGTAFTGNIIVDVSNPQNPPRVLDFDIQTRAGELPALTYLKALHNSSEKGTREGLLFASPFEADPSPRLLSVEWGSLLAPHFPLGVCKTPQATDCLRIEERITDHTITLFSRDAISGSLAVVPEPSIAVLLGVGLISAGIYRRTTKC